MAVNQLGKTLQLAKLGGDETLLTARAQEMVSGHKSQTTQLSNET